MKMIEEEIYNISKIEIIGGNDNLSYYTHFILAHGHKLSELIFEHSNDFYDDTEYIVGLYNKGVMAWSEHLKEDKIGLADVVGCEWFWNKCIKG